VSGNKYTPAIYTLEEIPRKFTSEEIYSQEKYAPKNRISSNSIKFDALTN